MDYAYEMGYEAARVNVSIALNPFFGATKEYRDWRRGWLDYVNDAY